MSRGRQALILWAGPKHSGKTSTATKLVEAMQQSGFTVGGFLAPSIYRENQLIGFEILDLHNGRRARLADRKPKGSDVVGFTFCDRGIQLGRQALQSAIRSSVDLVVVDEFGPLELDGRGWRSDVDLLLGSNSPVLLLVVRDDIVQGVQRLYHAFRPHIVKAADPRAVPEVKAVLQAVRDGGRAHGSCDSEHLRGHLT
jgi:nucleoside-triphosphatase